MPGTEGATGAAGANGTNGANAFTLLDGALTLPAVGAAVTSGGGVDDNSWAVVGMVVVAGDGTDFGTFRVTSLTGTTQLGLTFLGAPGDSTPGAIIASGSTISPGGAPQSSPTLVAAGGTGAATLTDRSVLIGRGTAAVNFAVPGAALYPLLSTGAATNPAFGPLVLTSGTNVTGALPVANGGSGAATATLARAALGVGGAGLSVYAAGTAYALTATPALLDFGTTDPSLTITSAGVWLLLARVRIDYNAKTTAAVRTITVLIRRTNNTAADIANSSAAFKTEIVTTLTYTLAASPLPAIIYTTVNANDILQIWGSADDISGAGTFDAVEASLVAVKLLDQTV